MRDPLPLHRVVLISKISLNGALSSLHSFTFSLNKVVLNILYLQEEKPHCKHKKLDLQRSFTVCGTCFFPPKCFLNGFFFWWWTKVQERKAIYLRIQEIPHNHHASDCNSKDTVLCFQQRNSSQLFTLTPVCQCIVHVYSIEYMNIYWELKGSALFLRYVRCQLVNKLQPLNNWKLTTFMTPFSFLQPQFQNLKGLLLKKNPKKKKKKKTQ